MNIRQITDKVTYVGVNDRVTYKFENLWVLPNGISYNSYLVAGSEKIALIDAVELGFTPDFMSNLHREIGERKIDYLIINHTEPDHSGSVPALLRLYPELKIVTNKIAIGMMKGFYGIDDSRFMEIKDQEELSLGDATLKFYMTPMVHWPETMMTFLKEEGVLFSGDAFGCYGALNGGIIDSEMESGWYIDEMYRYYSNIVAKYGKAVEFAIKKLSALDIKYICTLHGPVWNQRIPEVIDLYGRLGRYEGEDGVTIVYGSMYGNTGHLADVIANRLCANGIRNIKIHNVAHNEMSYVISDAFRYKGLIVGSPTYSMHLFPPVFEFLTAMEVREIKNKVVATFGSFTWSSAACNKMNECWVKLNMQPVATMDMRQAPNAEDIENAIALADKVAQELKKNA